MVIYACNKSNNSNCKDQNEIGKVLNQVYFSKYDLEHTIQFDNK